MRRVIVAGLGPGPAAQMTLECVRAMETADRVILRTGRHGAAGYLKEKGVAYQTLDEVYVRSEDYKTLHEGICRKINEIPDGLTVVYGVPGRGGAEDTAIRRLIGAPGIALEFLPGVGVEAQALCALAQAGNPQAEYAKEGFSVLPFSALNDFRVDPQVPLVLWGIDSRLEASEAKLSLLNVYPAGHQALFDSGGQARLLPLEELDRQEKYGHALRIVLPALDPTLRERDNFDHLVGILRHLRAPGGCPWDREQTHESLKRDLLEETYEALEAIEQGDSFKLCEELGDVLLQVVFHAQLAADQGAFDIDDVTTSICRKMIARHTHIFGGAVAETAQDVIDNWEKIKIAEKGLKDHAEDLKDVPSTFPALMRAQKVQKKAARAGFDWPDVAGALEKLSEEADEVIEAAEGGGDVFGEIGDLLFSVVNIARFLNVDAELALRGATEKFIGRFSAVERLARERGLEMTNMTLDALDLLWEEVKNSKKA